MRYAIIASFVLYAATASAQSRWYDATDYANAALAPGSGTNYYMDSINGLDTNDGLTVGTAWKTIGKLNGTTFSPGTRVLFKAGIYRGNLVLTASDSGTAVDRVMFGPYGDGAVKLDRSPNVTTWVNYSGQIYYADVANVYNVVVDEQALARAVPPGGTCTPDLLTEGSFCSTGTRVYVWCPGGGSPASRDMGVLQYDLYADGVLNNGADYITYYGLTFRFAGGHGLSVLGNNVRVELCRGIFNGKAAFSAFPYQGNLSANFEVIRSEASWNVMTNWPRGRYKWSGWSVGIVSQGTQTPTFEGNISHNNGGEGINVYGGGGGAAGGIMRDNIVYDNWSVNIYISNRTNAIVERNHVYVTGINLNHLTNNGDPTPGDAVNLKRLRADGILIGDEDLPGHSGLTIRNNIIVHCRKGLTYFAMAFVSSAGKGGLVNDSILNNTIVVADIAANEEVGGNVIAGMNIPYMSGRNSGTAIRNNIIYASDSYSYTLYQADSPGSGDSFIGLTLDHNLIYHSGRTNWVYWSGAARTYASWLALEGTSHGTGDVTSDPTLVDPTTVVALDKALVVGSPAIDVGFAVAVEDDWSLNARSTIDIGALEYAGSGGGQTLAVITTSFPNGTAAQAYEACAAATGGTPPYSWTVQSGSLCTGLNLTTSTGCVSGSNPSGSCTFTLRVTDSDTPTPATADSGSLSITFSAAQNLAVSVFQAFPGRNTRFKLAVPGLPAGVVCQVTYTSGGAPVATQTNQDEYAVRFFATDYLAPGDYNVEAVCPGFSQTATNSFTVPPYGDAATRTAKVMFPTPFISGAEQVELTYGSSPEFDQTALNTNCASGCAIDLNLQSGRFYLSWRWRDSGGNALTGWSHTASLVVD